MCDVLDSRSLLKRDFLVMSSSCAFHISEKGFVPITKFGFHLAAKIETVGVLRIGLVFAFSRNIASSCM